ncbi:hypothetical protein [Frigoriglobus tundricola]|uniref:Uncharacterized protein n=1 Tax=Frigoriglobus tundricola TaxID=2774151 RepID=A0A6M5Z3X4_9BACT|nr:hypothetical protein [Frigoriglobus tundricola]QJX01098.1 hypothetical protein FTUN_8737 [Frigoriglobus tundricola]
MSRYELRGREPYTVVVVGWDRPLSSFFAQVWDERDLEFGNPDDEPEPLLWAGCRAGEIRTVEHLDRVLSPYTSLSEEIRERLSRDRGGVNRTASRPE